MVYPVRNIGIVDTTGNLRYERLVQIAEAIQTQMNRDVLPVWVVGAIIRAFKTTAEIPADWWTCSIVEKITEGSTLNGVHWYTGTGADRTAYAKGKYLNILSSTFFESDLTKVISEEIIEMCIDPFGENKIKGKNPDPNSQDGQDVNFLVELGDPVQALQNGYYIGDVFVTNFIYPSYFYIKTQENVKYDHLGQFTQPFQLSEGGYQIFERANEWYQAWKINGINYYIKQGGSVPNANAANVKVAIYVIILGVVMVVFILIKIIFKKKNES